MEDLLLATLMHAALVAGTVISSQQFLSSAHSATLFMVSESVSAERSSLMVSLVSSRK